MLRRVIVLVGYLSVVVVLGAPAAAEQHAERIVAAFSKALGFFPESGIIQGADGAFYGTTVYGPTSNSSCNGGCGVVYRVTAGGQHSILHQFSYKDGAVPNASLLLARNGRLYGTTTIGPGRAGGTIFSLSPDGSQFGTIHRFVPDRRLDGFSPAAALIEGSEGYLYGTTLGGSKGATTIFRIRPDGRGFKVLHSSSGFPDTYNYTGSLLIASDGRLYGSACKGGAYCFGAVFRLDRDGSNYGFLHQFKGKSDGACPQSVLAEVPRGVLISTTSGGSPGPYQFGSFFKVSLDGTGFATIFGFDQARGEYPSRDITLGSDGRLYVPTIIGGAYGQGVVMRLDVHGLSKGVKPHWSVLHSFAGPLTDGFRGYGPIVLSRIDHNLYGVTSMGGPNVCGGSNEYCGVVYQVSL